MMVYKVVRKTSRGYYSAIVKRNEGGVKYELNKTTKPDIENSYLMAFDTIENASSFMRFCKNGESGKLFYLLSCRATIRYTFHWILCRSWIQAGFSKKLFAAFWNKCSHEIFGESTNPPCGTVFCSEITPLEIIK